MLLPRPAAALTIAVEELTLLKGAGVPMRFGIGSNRNKTADSIGLQQSFSNRVVRRSGVTLKNPILRCPWWYVTSASVEINVGNNGSITASIEYPSGTFWQAKSGGSATLSVIDGTNTDFDPIAGLTIPANTPFVVHCWGNGGTGGKFPQNAYISTARFGDGLDLGVSTVVADKTLVGGEGTANAGGQRAYTPIVLGTVPVSVRDVIALGDSILNGDTDDEGTTGGDAYGNFGAYERSFQIAGINYINMGRSSTKASQWQVVGAMTKRLDLIRGLVARAGLNELAHNDWPETVATWNGYMGIINARLAPFVGKIACATTTPYATSSTDGYTTQGGQILQVGSNLQSFNAAVLANSVTGQNGGHIDLAAQSANPGAPTYWRTPGDSGYSPIPASAITDDGTHLNVYGTGYAVPNLDVSALF